MELIIENAIFTKSGEFGILVSQEEHAVFGSKKNFLDTFKSMYPNWIYSRQYFEDLWNDYSKHNDFVRNWYESLMKYIYG